VFVLLFSFGEWIDGQEESERERKRGGEGMPLAFGEEISGKRFDKTKTAAANRRRRRRRTRRRQRRLLYRRRGASRTY
jgi:hypothetical protein